MSVFISGIGCISPQPTAVDGDGEVRVYEGNRLACVEPDYNRFFDARQIRRMSRVIRMSVTSAVLAMKDAGLEKTEGVIAGTALGCLEDTEAFLKRMVQNNEDMLSPTPFIYSTHNTIAAQIALHFGCAGYNSTYVHRNVSFESALLDAFMLLNDGTLKQVLTGGIDELTDSSFAILNRLGHFKKGPVTTADLYNGTKGSVAGEGAACFALSSSKGEKCYGEIKAVRTLSFGSTTDVIDEAKAIMKAHGVENVLWMVGYNGDAEDDLIFDKVTDGLNLRDRLVKYKHLCGEYATASAFGLWMAASMLAGKSVPGTDYEKPAHVLLYNQYQGLHHSLILVSGC